MKKRTRAALALTAILILAACGDDDVADTISLPTTSSVVAVTINDDDAGVTIVETTVTIVETTTTAEPLAGQEDLQRMALELADMPVGWSENPTQTEDNDSNSAFCIEDPDQLLDTDSWPRLDREFSAGSLGPFLAHSLLAAPDDDSAKGLMKQFAELAEQCRSWTDEDGSYSLSPVNYPQRGDQTFAVRLTAESDGFTFLGDVIVIREANVLTLLVPLGLVEPVEATVVVDWMDLIDQRD